MELDDMVRALVSESDEGARGYLRQSWLSAMLDALIQVRRAAGLTQAQVAERLGTTQSAVARLERDDDGGISLRRFVDYAIACGMVPGGVRFVSFAEAKAIATTPPDHQVAPKFRYLMEPRQTPLDGEPFDEPPLEHQAAGDES